MKRAPDQAKPRVAIYCRLSKDRSGLSENTGIQLRECREYAADEDWHVVAEFEENDISASRYSKKPRPKYKALVDLVRTNQIDRILGTEQERLHRRPEEMAELITLAETTTLQHVSFTNDESFDLSDADGIYRARLAVAAAERESRKTSKRQKRKKLAQARQGKPTGGRRPYGFEKDMITIREDEAVIYREIAHRVLAGHSCKAITYWLNEQGHTTTTGKKFYPITVRNLLLKQRYMGVREHLGVSYPAVWEPIIDAETFERVQLRMQVHAHTPPSQNAVRHLLTGLLICGRCGGRLTGRRQRDRPGAPMRRIYVCKLHGDTERRSGCSLRRNADALDAFIREAIIYRLDSPELAKLLSPADDDQLKPLLDARRAQAERKDQLVRDYSTGLLDAHELAQAKQAAAAELERIDADIARLTRSSHASGIVSAGQTVRGAWEANGTDWQRELTKLLITKITVYPGNAKPFYEIDGHRYRFEPKLIRIDWVDQEGTA